MGVRWVSHNFDSWSWLVKKNARKKRKEKNINIFWVLFLHLVKACIYYIFVLGDVKFLNLDFKFFLVFEVLVYSV